MESGSTIHVQQQRRMDPFYWILTFEVFTLFMLLGAGLVVVPPWLYGEYESKPLLFLFLLIPVGIWFVRISWRQLSTRIWHNRHLNAYRLEADRIDIQEWTPYERQPVFGRIDLSAVNRVICGKYVSQNYYAYKSSRWTERQKRVHLLPVLYIVHSEIQGEPKILAVRFFEDDGINRWLNVFSNKGIPLSFSGVVIGEQSGPEQLQAVLEDEHHIPFEFSGNIYRQMDELVEQVSDLLFEQQARQEAGPGSSAAGPVVIKPEKSRFWGWLAAALPAIALQIGGLFGIVILAENGVIHHDNMWVGMGLLVMAQFVYIGMQRSRHPLHILWFMLMSILVVAITGVSLAERGFIAEEMTTTVMAAAILYAAVSWIPHLIMRRVGRDTNQNKA